MIAKLLRKTGYNAYAVSGNTKSNKRKQILEEYEGWDSLKTEVLFMVRPTMSKTIYLQQLGEGMRIATRK